MNIYVGNLARDVTEEDLTEAFATFGKIATVSVIKDKFTGEPRGFGFVEMPNSTEARAAITGLNGKDVRGQSIVVNEARPRGDQRGGGGGGGGPRRGGGGGGRRY